jgi:hypothetical protein
VETPGTEKREVTFMDRTTRFLWAAGVAIVIALAGGGSALAQDTANPVDGPGGASSGNGAGWQ